MQESKTTWICLRCKQKWVDHHKADPRYCPLCGSCTIYAPRMIKIPKYRNSNLPSMKKQSILQIGQIDFQNRKEIEAITT